MGLGPRLVLRVLGLVLGKLRRVVGLPLGWLLGLVLVVPLVPRLPRLPNLPRVSQLSELSQLLRRTLLGLETVSGRQGRRNPQYTGRHLGRRNFHQPGPDQLHPGRDNVPQHTDLFPCPEHGIFEPCEVHVRSVCKDDLYQENRLIPCDYGFARQIRIAFGCADFQCRPQQRRAQQCRTQ